MADIIHPSKDIVGSKSTLLTGKKIALGICGSVAASASPELARELMRNGADVIAVMTEAAQELISPMLMEWATGNPVVTSLTGELEHVALGGGVSGSADLVLIAPATANTIGKIAAGIDDTPVATLATTAIGAGIPIVVAPAMHGSMYRHIFVLDNIKKLRSIGVTVLPPDEAEGKAKIPSLKAIVDAVKSRLKEKDLVGRNFLITAGPTRSYLDAIRYLTNSSSGKMGLAIAEEAMLRGANVTLILGPSQVQLPNCRIVNVETTEEMLHAVTSELLSGPYDTLVMAAAPLDFKILKASNEKISSESEISMKLSPLPKIVKEARKLSPKLFIIGFKAEYGLNENDLKERAQARLDESDMDLIVANDLRRSDTGFESDTNEVYILDATGKAEHVPLSSKREVASRVLDSYVNRRSGVGSS